MFYIWKLKCLALYSPFSNHILKIITVGKSCNSIPVFIQTPLLKILIYNIECLEEIFSATVIHKLCHIQCNTLLLNIQFMCLCPVTLTLTNLCPITNTLTTTYPKFYSPVLLNKNSDVLCPDLALHFKTRP